MGTVCGTNSVCWVFQKVLDTTATLRDGYMDLSQTTPPQQHRGNRGTQQWGDRRNKDSEPPRHAAGHPGQLPQEQPLVQNRSGRFTNLLPSWSSPAPPHPISRFHQICCPQEPSPSQTWVHSCAAGLLLFKK